MPRYGGYDTDDQQKRDRFLRGCARLDHLKTPCNLCAWANFKSEEGPCLDCSYIDVKEIKKKP